MYRLIATALIAALLPVAAVADDLLEEHTKQLLHEALSGERAKDHVIEITRFSRIQGSRQYRTSGEYVLEQLRSAGFDDASAYVESFPSDGRIHYQTWQSPPGFDMTRAELRVVEPFDERIVGYPEIGMSLMTYSNAGEFEGELVWVGEGTANEDYEGQSVEGKVVLATGYGGEVHRRAVIERGALGVVCFLDDDRAKEYPDMLQYTGMWPRAAELDDVTFGFNLTNRQGERLRDMVLAGERVVVRGVAEGIGLEDYFMDVVVADIEGSEHPDDVLLVSAHLDHPKESANDNASGSAAILDLAMSLKRLIAEGRLPAPKRTIRFLWVPEFFGTMAYLDAHPEIAGPDYGGSVLANLNLDMVGENLELLHSRAIFTRTPASIPSVLNDVVENMAQMVDNMDVRTPRGSLSTFNWALTPFSGGSDHMVFIDRRIPGVMFNHTPDYTHHTSEDTVDKVDPVELEREEIIAGATLLYLSDLDAAQAGELTWLAAANAAQRLGLAGRRANGMVAALGDGDAAAAFDAFNVLDRAHEQARATVSSVRHFRDPAGDAVEHALATLDAQHARLHAALRSAVAATGIDASVAMAFPDNPDHRIAVRTTRGPIDRNYLLEHLGVEALAWYQSDANPVRGDLQFELHNLLDGSTTISEVRNVLSAEFSPVPLAAVKRYVEALAGIDLVRWATPD